MKKLSILLFVLACMLLTGCKPDNYLYGYEFVESQMGYSTYHTFNFYSKDSCSIVIAKHDLLISSETCAYKIKSRRKFIVNSNGTDWEFEYNHKDNTIKAVHYPVHGTMKRQPAQTFMDIINTIRS